MKKIIMAVLMMVAAVSCFAYPLKEHEVDNGKIISGAVLAASTTDEGTTYEIRVSTIQRLSEGQYSSIIRVILLGDLKTLYSIYNNKYANTTAEEMASSIEEMFISANDKFHYNSDDNAYEAVLTVNYTNEN